MSKYPPEQRAAAYFFHLLGDPKEFADRFSNWFNLMRDAMGDAQITDVDEMKRFLKWAVMENAYSRKYLMVAGDPMVSLRKNAGQLSRRWRVENPIVDLDPLWNEVRIPDGEDIILQKHPRRKPKTVTERREFLAKFILPRGRTNDNFLPWLAQDKCPKCGGKGYINERTGLANLFWKFVLCECVSSEELL